VDESSPAHPRPPPHFFQIARCARVERGNTDSSATTK
jgi:hypothetical protein